MKSNTKKRAVFYISGFDPRGARQYYQMYKTHAKKQSQINKYDMNISQREKVDQDLYRWNISSKYEGYEVSTEYYFLAWDDIIKQEWSKGLISHYRDLLFYFMSYFMTGLVFRFAKESSQQLIAGLYPAVYMILLSIATILSLIFGISFFDNTVIGLFVGLGLSVAVLKIGEKLGNKIAVFWILRIITFSVRYANKDIQNIDGRIELFAKYVHNAIRNKDLDEVLLVSHSVGTILAVNVASKALKTLDKNYVQKFSMLTLGECIPLVSLQNKSGWYMDDLKDIIQNYNIQWDDYTSTIDGACFPLYDFTKKIDNKKTNIKFSSPRFYKLFYPNTYKRLRRDWYKAHFLYLMSYEIEGQYDYFIKTAGINKL